AAVIGGARSLVALARLVGRRGGDEADAALRQRLGQRRERHHGVMRPAVGVAVAEREVIVARPLYVGHRNIVLGGKAETVGAAVLVHCSTPLQEQRLSPYGGHRLGSISIVESLRRGGSARARDQGKV